MLIRLNVAQSCAFWGAAAHGYPEQMRLLLDYGASADVRSDGGYTPLDFASVNGRLRAARSARFLVLELNADVNARDDEGTTPLHLAPQGWIEGTPEVVQFLLEHGADVMAHNNNGETSYGVAWGEQQEGIQELLSKYATGITGYVINVGNIYFSYLPSSSWGGAKTF